MEKYDPDYMNKMSSAERVDRFIPVSEIPDPGLNPAEVLMAAEEPAEDEKIKPYDINDISRQPVHERQQFTNMDMEPIPDTIHVEDTTDRTAQIIEKVEQASLKEPLVEITRLGKHRGHGVRGKIPPSKNRMSEKLNSAEIHPENN